jgi:geranyl-CoA carboxylase alpha subunit
MDGDIRHVSTSFRKILIANRGEIACRIMRTAHAMGYTTAAVFSDADRDAQHVKLADEAVALGGLTAAESYLDIAKLLDAARRSGADAVHPGYGFLSENTTFASACRDAGLAFIGPSPEAIAAMGNKAAAKRLMLQAGVPCVPGYQGSEQSDARLTKEARTIGFPLMVKAAAGGGGRGMRLIATEPELANGLTAARREALAAFGSDELILEKAIIDARHIEIQVFGDNHGNIIHLGERDCSIQRRHQKVIEEAPSSAVNDDLRALMGAAAVAAAKAIKYTSAGTVEFLLDTAGHFYFLEMNTRIQVEHPVTEAITGLDLVRMQLEVAAGKRLPLRQEQVTFNGHAIQARVYAEDPHAGFLPRSGAIASWAMPAGDGIRVDHGLAAAPTEISPYYDPMIAKVIAHGATREEARRRLLRALDATHIHGITTNRTFLSAALAHQAFAALTATTGFIAQHFAPKSAAMARPQPSSEMLALAAALLFARGATNTEAWRSNGPRPTLMKLSLGRSVQAFRVTSMAPRRFHLANGAAEHVVSLVGGDSCGPIRYAIDGHERTAHMAWDGARLHLDAGNVSLTAEDVTLAARSSDEGPGAATLRAPMNGRIVSIDAKAGDAVKKGQRLVVLEAMKMQHEITAERDGTVESCPVKAGDQVATRQVLVSLSAI